MKLIVGLGNPGKLYRGTRHNVGSETIERLVEEKEGRLKKKWRLRASATRVNIGDSLVTVAIPRTFMNVSGGPVSALLRWEKRSPSDLLVVSDDINLGLGMIRIRRSGSSGGHKGLQSIVDCIGTEDFARLRIGVGHAGQNRVKHVLGRFTAREAKLIEEARERALLAMEEIVVSGLDAAMNKFNSETNA